MDIRPYQELVFSGATRPEAFRREQLRRLYQAVESHGDELAAALAEDLGKSAFEAYETEIGGVLHEIRWMERHLRRFLRPKRVRDSVATLPSRGWVIPEPKGCVLIISPWNYPVLLTLSPLIAAIAAGNTVVVKPSELAPASSRVLARLLNEAFPAEYIICVEGGADTADGLLRLPFDHIFFTGSPRVGRIVMRAAAEHLTPVTLELGGKSPCIVDHTADLALAARRIAWGKTVNAGQTCVAPDYLLVEESVAEELLCGIRREICRMYGEHPIQSPDYPCIIAETHFDRLLKLCPAGTEFDRESRKIAPVLLEQASPEDPAMQEEIFGPILPVLRFRDMEKAMRLVRGYPKPLALYLFTRDRETERKILGGLSFGGGCVNDTILHLTNPNLPFGGIGESGIGAYHAKAGFDAFTHQKSVLKRSRFDNPLRYPPYRENALALLKKVFH